MNGNGTYTDVYNSGNGYTGQFENNAFHGFGTLKKPNGHVYTGEFANNMYHGHGEAREPDGSRYVGQFVNGVVEGNGTYEFGPGKVVLIDKNDKMSSILFLKA